MKLFWVLGVWACVLLLSGSGSGIGVYIVLLGEDGRDVYIGHVSLVLSTSFTFLFGSLWSAVLLVLPEISQHVYVRDAPVRYQYIYL